MEGINIIKRTDYHLQKPPHVSLKARTSNTDHSTILCAQTVYMDELGTQYITGLEFHHFVTASVEQVFVPCTPALVLTSLCWAVLEPLSVES